MSRIMVLRGSVLMAAGLAFNIAPARGDQVVVPADRDGTLYQTFFPTSNGAGQHFFAGMTGIFDQTIRRGLIRFDVAGAVPAGSTITGATLTLNMSKANFGSGAHTVNLHRVLSDWGEGDSDAPGEEGGGTISSNGDVTWDHTFYSGQFWTTPGGDFSATISAGQSIDEVVGPYTWGSTAQMAADVQAWLDAPAANFGWMLRGNEITLGAARRFDAHEHPTPSVRPVLVIDYVLPEEVPCDFDGDGDVDLLDYDQFAPCLTGPLVPVSEGCDPGDTEPDVDVDLADFAVLQDRLKV